MHASSARHPSRRQSTSRSISRRTAGSSPGSVSSVAKRSFAVPSSLFIPVHTVVRSPTSAPTVTPLSLRVVTCRFTLEPTLVSNSFKSPFTCFALGKNTRSKGFINNANYIRLRLVRGRYLSFKSFDIEIFSDSGMHFSQVWFLSHTLCFCSQTVQAVMTEHFMLGVYLLWC